ncbi:Multidrug resistance-associated protein 4 [Sarcoptes scabiei]|uniref:Multidrug resistance-associated protein 4 n=1 Tax=Sarcoptes scabiei TaxID=52283 RepID=A0A834RAZ4_SARSC|nr:Multidrug resistance-associated protein 4 [Sarcoptes scabiei]
MFSIEKSRQNQSSNKMKLNRVHSKHLNNGGTLTIVPIILAEDIVSICLVFYGDSMAKKSKWIHSINVRRKMNVNHMRIGYGYGFVRMIEPIFLGRFIFHINLHREEQFIRNKPQNGSSFSNSSSVNQTYLPSFVADQPINWLSFLAISTTNHLHNAYFFAALLCSTIMVNFVINHPYFMENFRTGLHVRVALTRLIYEKALKVSNTAVQRNTIGRIVNLISTDASRFDICFTAVYFFYCAIIHCAVGMFFLYIYLEELSLLNTKGNHSIAFLGTLILMVLYVPLQAAMANILSRFRSKSILLTDDRLRLMAEILPAMRVIKMYCWERPFARLVNLARRLEITEIRHAMILRSINLAIFFVSNKMMEFACIIWFLFNQKKLTAETVFVVISLIYHIRESMTQYFPMAVSYAVESYISLLRIEKFLLEEEKLESDLRLLDYHSQPTTVSSSKSSLNPYISLKSVTVRSDFDGSNILEDISFNVVPGQLTVIIGQVGSGKSSILYAILKEYALKSGSIKTNGSIIYASQEAWIFNGTVRQNILFGKEFDPMKYAKVVKVAALEADLENMVLGDQTRVDDRGTSLSGGQRARISLARALYADADCYLLDDPLSAKKVVILVTHQLQFIKQADQIVILKNGTCLAAGTYEGMLNKGIDLFKYTATEPSESKVEQVPVEHIKLSPRNSLTSLGQKPHQFLMRLGSFNSDLFRTRSSSMISSNSTVENMSLMDYIGGTQLLQSSDDSNYDQVETENYGTKSSSFKMYWAYTRMGAGFFLLTTFIVTTILTQFIYTGTDYWLSAWTDYQENLDIQNRIHSIPSNEIQLFSKAPILFFDKTPVGIIMNRVSRDLGIIDDLIPPVAFEAIEILGHSMAVFILCALLNYYILIPFVILAFVLYWVIKFYVNTARNIKRLEANARSPLFNQMATTLAGLPTIRSYQAEKMFIEKFTQIQNTHSSVLFTFLSASRLFGIIMEVMCLIYIYCLIFYLLLNLEQFPGSIIGLTISQSLTLTSSFNWGVRQSTEVETYMTSVERIIEFGKLDKENIDDCKTIPPDEWPTKGDVVFENVCLHYPGCDEPVLKNLTFSIKAGEKIGIVGRTGAGKSSIITALFRLTQPAGKIYIDGIDTSEIALTTLRKNLSIIPQEPIFFSGTIRKNLDPFNEKSDPELWNAIEKVQLKSKILSLDASVSESGTDFSVGQKQLICLARAIIRKNRILVLDEATANVDPRTDSFIQETIRKDASLNTIIDYDKVLVLDHGRLMQFDTPYRLINQESGIFYELFDNLGSDIKSELIEIARLHDENLYGSESESINQSIIDSSLQMERHQF